MDLDSEKKLLEIIKRLENDVYKLKKENLIIKYIINKMLHISVDDLYKEK